MATVAIDLETLTEAALRDLANAFLRAAWSATLPETRTLLLDLLVEAALRSRRRGSRERERDRHPCARRCAR